MGRGEVVDFARLRKEMVQEQLLGRGIKDPRVIEAFLKVPRERFVPKRLQMYAYDDGPLSIGYGQTISQPYMVALMTELLDVDKRDKVLEIGTGSGYQTAILAELAGKVYSVERIPELAERAREVLQDLGYANVRIRVGDGTLGWDTYAPYDKIIVTAGAPKVPAPLIEQLASGGRMVIPVGPRYHQILKVLEKTWDGDVVEKEDIPCIFVPLIGAEGWQE